MFVWSYCTGSDFGLVYPFFMFMVVSAVSDVVFFSVCVVSAFVAAVDFSVVLFGEFFSTVGTFCFWVFYFDFHLIACSILFAVFSPIPSTDNNCSFVKFCKSDNVCNSNVSMIAVAFFALMP